MRPKGWATRSVKSYMGKDMKDCTGREIFEAGADAYEEGLRKEGLIVSDKYVTTIEVSIIGDNPLLKQMKLIEFKSGRVVFIEE